MKNPNGYGSVLKLSGKRRKPFAVRITVGWNDQGKQKYKYIGYYETRSSAMIALADYHQNPYDLDAGKITFEEVFKKWSDEKYPNYSKSNIIAYNSSYKACSPLYELRFVDIKKSHLQNVIDTCGKNYPMLRKIKVLFNQLYRYALENDLVTKDYSEFVEISHHKKEDNERDPFSSKEISTLWDNVDRNEYNSIILMLIYSGVRISELLNLKKENVHLDEKYFDVVSAKTKAGIRKVPISDKTIQYFSHWMSKSSTEYLLVTPDGDAFTYRNYYDSYWKPLITEMNMKHTPHDTRHTTVSLLVAAHINQTIIKRIVGHAGAMSLTERVYTHFEIQQLIDAINKI